MKRILGTCMCMGLVGLLATAAYGQSELRMGGSVAAAMAGNNVIIGSAGGNVTVVLVLTDTDAAGLGPVRSYQMALVCAATPLGGATGTVSHDVGGATACGASSPCNDVSNPDHIFFAINGGLPATNTGPCPPDPNPGFPRGGSVATTGPQAQNCGPGEACYALEFSYAISGDAHGDHGVTVQDPDLGQGGNSFIRAEPLANLLFAFGDPGAIIRIPVGACCDGVNCIDDGVNETECTALGGTFSEGTDCQDPAACECSNDGQCNDGLACNGDETCDVGGTNLCLPGTPLVCDDTNDCTIDSCDDATGCVFDAAAANGDACDDPADTDCSNPDTCNGGACDPNDEAGGTACGNGSNTDCDNPDTCNGTGGCLANNEPAGPAPGGGCDDSNVCTTNDCDNAGSCVNPNLPDGSVCDDNDACTSSETDPDADTCTGGNCGGPAVDCNDGNPCTTDGCDSGSGCTNVDIPNCDVPLGIVPGAECVAAPASCCVDEGTTLCVDITAANGGTGVCGAQIFLEFDTCSLQVNGILPSADYPNVLVSEWDNAAGTITIAVGVADGDPCITVDSVIATVCFDTAVCTDCCPAQLIQWGEFNPQIPIKLTNDAGEELPNQLLDPPDIGVNDGVPVINLPDDISVPSDVGKCIAVVDFETSANDCGAELGLSCAQETIQNGVNLGDLGLESGDKFPVGCTTFTCTTDPDCCGNTTTDSFDVCVTGTTQGIFDIQLSPTIEDVELTRCIEFCFFNCDSNNGGAVEFACVEQEVQFGGIFSPPGVAQQVKVAIPCTFGEYDCASARDPLHTLRSFATDFGWDFDAGAYTGTWAGSASWLIGGNLDGNTVIDIVDFGAWLGQFNLGQPVNPNTTCLDSPVHADINGDGLVTPADFTFILVNFFAKEDDCCDIGGIEEEPRSSVRVRDLQREGLGHLRVADLNNDGWIDIDDMLLYAEGNGIDVPQEMGGGFTPRN